MTGHAWWYPIPRDGEQVPDYPPVYLGEVVAETIHFPADPVAERLAQPPAPEDLTVTFTADTSGFDDACRAAYQTLLEALGTGFTAVCPGCRRDTHWLDYDLGAESCRACLEVIPRLQKTTNGAWVDWAPHAPELHWRPTR